MRPRGAPERGPGRQGRSARGRRSGQPSRGLHSRGLPHAAEVLRRLGSLRRARAGPRRAAALPAARQDDRRLGLDERHDLPARQPRRLRRLGDRRRQGVELRRGPALLQAVRGQRPGRGCVPRRRRAAERVRQPLDDARDRHDARGERARGPRLQPRLQRRTPGRRRPLPEHAAQRAPPFDGRRLPAPGRGPPESRRDHRRDGTAPPVRGHACSRRAGRAWQRCRGDPCRA